MNKTIFLSLFLLATPLQELVYGQAVTYQEYTESTVALRNARKLYKQGHPKEALAEYKGIRRLIDLRLDRQVGIARCQIALHKPKKALSALKSAFRYGLPFEHLQNIEDSLHFAAIWPQIKKAYPVLRARYLASIDTVLREELDRMVGADKHIRHLWLNPKNAAKKDSLMAIGREIGAHNTKRLREIVQAHGWPGYAKIGFYPAIGTWHLHVFLLVIHADEENYYHFLPFIIKAASRNQTSWMDTEGIMANLFFRFNYEDKHAKLRFTYLTRKGELDEKRSYFQLANLAKFLRDNPRWKCELFLTTYSQNDPPDSRNSKALTQIKAFLLKEGVEEKQLAIDEQMQLVSDDGLGTCQVGLRGVGW